MQTTDGNLGLTVTGFDPFELPDTIQLGPIDDPYPLLAAARRRGPVQHAWPLGDDLFTSEVATIGPAASVLGYEEAVTVLRDHETYSSEIVGAVMGAVLGPALIAMDEPEHRAHRALVARAFGPKLLARWEHELVRRVADELIDEFTRDGGRADLVRRFTFALPVRVIARILGLPERDAPQFQRWSIELISAVVNWDRGIAASRALGDYFAEQVDERRAHPRDDLITELVDAEVDGRRLSDDEIFGFLRLLLPAGIETTYRSLGNLLFALLSHPDQLDEVTRDRELRPAAIEEGLRWETPLVLIVRETVRDTELAGVALEAGTAVNVFIASANRDERRYEDPDRFDIHRPLAPHASFGSGPHTCLGVHLARMESRVALDALLDRLDGLAFDLDAPAPRIVGSIFRSPDTLPVRFAA